MHCLLVLTVFLVASATSLRIAAEKRVSEKAETGFGIVDLLFKFADTNMSGGLDYMEVRELFNSHLFSANANDIMWVIMSRDIDKSLTLDREEWRSIEFSKTELELFEASPQIPILA
ncbi:uncharacterized protein LOC111133083 [Crassostrea virginica]